MGNGTLVSDVAEPLEINDGEPREPALASYALRARDHSAAGAALAMAVAAVVALLVFWFVGGHAPATSTGSDGPARWQRPYAVLLMAILAAALVAALAQRRWRAPRPAVSHYAPLVAGAVSLACLWDLATDKFALLQPAYFPGPDRVLAALTEDRRLLLLSAWHSLRLLLCGYSAGVAAGVVSGVLVGWFPRVRYWGMPALKVLGPVPATALVPLVMTIFRDSFPGAAGLIAFAVWFPVTMLTASGVANVRLAYLDVARTLGAGPRYLVFRVAVPSAAPSIFLGLFMGLGAAFLTLIVAETVGVQAGLGWYLKWQQGYGDYAKVYASLVLMAAFFSTLMTLLFRVRDRVLRWQQGVIRW